MNVEDTAIKSDTNKKPRKNKKNDKKKMSRPLIDDDDEFPENVEEAKRIESELNAAILRGEKPSNEDMRKYFVALGFDDELMPVPEETAPKLVTYEDKSSRPPPMIQERSSGLLTYEDKSSPFASLNNVATPMRLRRSGLAPAPNPKAEIKPKKKPKTAKMQEDANANPSVPKIKRCPNGTIKKTTGPGKGKVCIPKKNNKLTIHPEDLVLDPPDKTQETNKRPAKTAMNRFLDEKEQIERENLLEDHDFLYPELNDPNFNIKLALKREFQDAQYDGQIRDIEKQANILCKAKFELSPHQVFVKNFLSAQTPYKGLLLYHGLGTGKTCSAIGVAEEMRRYMKRTGIKQQIIVVASPNVQGNFRQQLFDERKLTKVTNIANPNEYTWNIESCVGNSLIHEINPNSIRNLSRDKLISNINALINEHYRFVGYIQFANIARDQIGESKDKVQEERNIRRFFDGRLVIIDEVHNIRLADDSNQQELQQVAAVLMTIVKSARGLRLLLLSATPMFNSYKEIIWITNLLNSNDGRSQIQVADVFLADGSFRPADKTDESGDELLRRKLTGYVSYVRGENPYTFPYRLYPAVFSPDRALSAITYPANQMNGSAIDVPIRNIQAYVNRAQKDSYQMRAYSAIIDYMRRKSHGFYTNAGIYREMPSFENMESFGYTLLQRPLEALNIVYPDEDLSAMLAVQDADKRAQQYGDDLFQNAVGGKGLSRVVSFASMENDEPLKHDYEYRTKTRVFSPDQLPNYSVKMSEICRAIKSSEGIVLIYSQYIDGGVVPMALALEEMGFTRYCHGLNGRHKHLFKKAPTAAIDALTMEPSSSEVVGAFQPAQYIMITGDKGLSPSNTEDVKYATNSNNMDGSKVKVILISKAGSEGLDFKAIRQIHIMEPWFNMNRIEQIIGRGVRNLSHCALPFQKRNVQIYLHSTVIDGKDEETADLYLYRLAEKKAGQIGKVTRLLKESAADCILNIGQTNFTATKLSALAANQNIRLQLSTKDATNGLPREVDFQIGDLDGSELCDYMSCEFQCRPKLDKSNAEVREDSSSYTESNVESNIYYIIGRIKELYRENHAYTLDQIRAAINAVRNYPVAQIYYVLSRFVSNRNMVIFDKFGRFGYLINRAKLYEFQPLEITDERASIYERSRPVEYKRKNIVLELPTEFRKTATEKNAPDAVNTNKNIERKMRSYKSILKELKEKYALVETEQSIKSTEMNWYKNASHASKHMQAVYGVEPAMFKRYVVFHYLDAADYATKCALFEHAFNKERGNKERGNKERGNKERRDDGNKERRDDEYEEIIAAYFNHGIMKSKDGQTAMYIADKETARLLIKDDATNTWKEGDKFDAVDFKQDIADKYIVDKQRLNEIVGYMLQFKDQDMSFYYKNIRLARNKKGRKCDRSGGKAPIITMLNTVTDSQRYNESNTDSMFMYSGTLCVILEMVLRRLQETKNKHNKIYCLTPEEAILNKITDYSAV